MGLCGLPYLPDHNMRIELSEEDEKIVGYTITADELSADAYLRFVAALESYSYKDSAGTTYKFISSDADASGMGLEDTTVLRLTPTEKYMGMDVRTFVRDEYYLLGFDSTGKFVMTSFMVNAMLDGYFLGAEVAEFGESLWGFSKNADQILPELCKIPLYYFSEYSSEKIIVPEVGSNASFYPISYLSSYPFSSWNDEWDLAFQVITENNSQEIQDSFVAALLAAGYVLQAPEKEGQTYDVYLLENAEVGKIEYTVYPFEEKTSSGETVNAITFDVFYKAPEEYTSHLRDIIEDVASISGITPKAEDAYGSAYTDYGVAAYALGTAKLSSYESEDHALEIITDIAYRFLDEGDGVILVKDEIEFNEAEEEGDEEYYSVVLSSGDIEADIVVSTEAGEDGSHEVEIDIFDDKYTLSSAEVLAGTLSKSFNSGSHFGLRGVDYVANEDGSFSISDQLAGTAENLSDAAEAYGALFDGFTLGSSEGCEEVVEPEDVLGWEAVYDNREASLQIVVSAVPAEEAGKIDVTISVAAHRYVTPTTTIVAFLTALNGSAPSEDAYVVNPDESTSAVLAVEGTGHEASELQGIAEGFKASLPEGFVQESSAAASESSWAVFAKNEETGIQVTLTATLGEGGAVSGSVLFEFIPAPLSNAELAMIATLQNFEIAEPVKGTDYSQVESQDYFYSTFAVDYATEETNLQDEAEYYSAAAAGATWYQLSSAASTYQVSEDVSFDSWKVLLVTSDYSQGMIFETFVAGGYVYLSITSIGM